MGTCTKPIEGIVISSYPQNTQNITPMNACNKAYNISSYKTSKTCSRLISRTQLSNVLKEYPNDGQSSLSVSITPCFNKNTFISTIMSNVSVINCWFHSTNKNRASQQELYRSHKATQKKICAIHIWVKVATK